MGSPLDRPRRFLANLAALRYREVTMAVAAGAVVAATLLLSPGAGGLARGFDDGVGPATLAFLFVVASLAAVVKGALGFGAGVVATPVFAAVIDPTMAVAVLAIMPWMLSWFLVGETGTGLAYVREEWPLLALAVVGTLVGLAILSTVRAGVLVPLLMGLLLVAYVGYEVLTGYVTVEAAHHPTALGAAGFLQGVLAAAANMGPVLPAYLHTFERDAERYVGGLSMVFAVILTVRIAVMIPLGLLTPYRLWLGSAIATASVGGLLVGTALRRRGLDRHRFERAVLALLLVVGLGLLARTVPRVLA